MTTVVNPFENAARAIKADALIAVLRQHRFTRAHIDRMNKRDWETVARVVGVRCPSWKTIDQIKDRMRRRK